MPITGIAFCCAQTADGHPPIALTSKITKARRLIPAPRSAPEQGLSLNRRHCDNDLSGAAFHSTAPFPDRAGKVSSGA